MKTVTFGLFSFVILLSCNQEGQQLNENKFTENNTIKIGKIIDLTHSYSSETVYWVTAKEFHLDTVAYGETENGFFYSANNFETAEHGGTHIDAPIHFAKGKQSVDEIPLEKLVGEGIKIDVSQNVRNNADYLVTIKDFEDWESKKGRIPDNSIVLLETGFGEFYPDKVKYMGTDKRGEEAIQELHFPGLSPEAAQWLVDNRNINAIGVDTPSIDYGQSTKFESHVILLQNNIPAFENVANLDQLPSENFLIMALPMKIKGGSGGPLRIISILR